MENEKHEWIDESVLRDTIYVCKKCGLIRREVVGVLLDDNSYGTWITYSSDKMYYGEKMPQCGENV